MQSITSFALYGFPESHAASFALLAYASAYLKCHYLAAFTAAMLNNQPMGFYRPAMLVKDAQRHGLRVLPVDVQRLGVGLHDRRPRHRALRLGLRYVRGLRAEAGAGDRGRRGRSPSIDDLARRVPVLRKDEMNRLAGDRRAESAAADPPPRRALASGAGGARGRTAARDAGRSATPRRRSRA